MFHTEAEFAGTVEALLQAICNKTLELFQGVYLTSSVYKLALKDSDMKHNTVKLLLYPAQTVV